MSDNYMYDEYIKSSYLNAGLRGAFELDLNSSIRLMRFLRYGNPTTHAQQMTQKRDHLIANAIGKKLSGKKYDEDLYDYATKIDLRKLINCKFDLEELKEKYNFLTKLNAEELEEYKNSFKLPIEEEALVYMLLNKSKVKTK